MDSNVSQPRRAETVVRDWWWVFDPRLSLRARASLIFGAAAVLFALLLGWLGGALLQSRIEHQLGTALENLAFQVSDKIDRAFHERYRDLQFTISLPPFRADGISADERRRLLDVLQLASPEFAWIGFADANGRIVAATHGLPEGTMVADRAWYREAREAPYVGDWHEIPELAGVIPYGPNEPRGFVDLAVPVSAESGQFLGVLVGHIRWGWTREVQTSVIPDRLREERLGVTIYAASGNVLLDSGGSGWSEPPDAPELPENRRFRGTLLENTTGGTVYLTGYVRSRGYQDFPGLGWLISVRQPGVDAFAPVRELRRSLVGCGAVFSLGIAFLSWAFAGAIAHQLRRVTATAVRVRRGDILAVMPRPPGEGEFARMSGALGDMVDEFRRVPNKQDEPDEPPAAGGSR